MTSEKHAIWPALERNRALIGLPFSFLAIGLSIYSLYIASLSNARSSETASRMTELSQGSFVQLKQQTLESQRQSIFLSEQLEAQKRLSENTATQLNDVVSGLSSQVAYLSQQTDALRSLVQRSEEDTTFATKPFGWWRDAPASNSRNPGLAALAFSTLRSSEAAWPEKENALAFLSDHEIPADGLISRDLLIETTAFHNRNMRNADFTSSTLSNVLFAPISADYILALQGSRFKDTTLWGLKISSADMTNALFKDATLRRSQLQNVVLANADFTGATLQDVVIHGDMRNSTLAGATLTHVALECGNGLYCAPPSGLASNAGYRWSIDYYTLLSSLEMHLGTVARTFPERSVPILRNSTFNNSRFSLRYPLYRLDFNNASAKSSSFAEQIILNADLRGATFSDTSFRNAILRDVDASGATFSGVDFEGARLQGVNFAGAVFASDRELAGATLENVLVNAFDLFRLQGARLGADDDDAESYLYVEQTGNANPEFIFNFIAISGTCRNRGFRGFKIITDPTPDRVIESDLGRRLVIDLPGGLLTSRTSGFFVTRSETVVAPPPCK